MLNNRRITKIKDFFLQTITYLSSFVSLGALLIIVGFLFSKGIHLLNINLITENYLSTGFVADVFPDTPLCNCEPTIELGENVYYSPKWGIALVDSKDLLGKNVVEIEYVHANSPLRQVNDKGIGIEPIRLRTDYDMIRIAFDAYPTALSRFGAQNMIQALEANNTIREMEFQTTGGGIRGSIITTLYLIFFTLLFALPIGIGAAIYLNEFAKPSRWTRLLRTAIETLTGVPSIIYGLMGLAIFVPLTVSLTDATGGNILSGAMTLAVILLPIIIRTTEESLKVVPDDFRQASLALGANATQTTFKVVLPSAFPGILSATLLAIGRIVGESAALVFAIGTSIKDHITVTGKSTSLAVHIWAMMTDEPANIELSATIALIIVFITVILNLVIKILSTRYLKRKLGGAHE